MGKMLIIKGVTYTPPSGNGGGGSGTVEPDPDPPVITPDPPAPTAVYKVFYRLESQDKWYSDRSLVSNCAAVGIVIMDAFDIDLESITYSKPDTLNRVLFFPSNKPASERGWSDTEINNPMQNADEWDLNFNTNSTQNTPSWLRSLFVWVDDPGSVMTSSRVDEVVAAIQSALIFNCG